MEKQLVLFVEPHQLEAELGAVLEQLSSENREAATQLLTELMARILEGSHREGGEVGSKEGANE